MTRTAKARRNRPRADAAAMPKPAPPAWAVAAMLGAAIGIVYGPFLGVPFVFDDDSAIVKNASIRSFSPLFGTNEQPGPLNPPRNSPPAGRPLANLSFAINYSFGGLQPDGYHLFNAAVHFLSAFTLWAIVRRTLLQPYFKNRFADVAGWLAFAIAMLWALHPLQTETVIYATQRTELMVALFYLTTLYCSQRYWAADNASKRVQMTWLALATLACWCGMASKEVMVSAPLMVLLFERTFVAGSLANAMRQSWRLFAGLASAWLLLLALNWTAPRSQSASFDLGVSKAECWLTQCKVFLMYLKLVVWPAPLLFHYELPYLKTFSQSWMYVLSVSAIGAAALVLLWRNRPLGYLASWVLAILAPTSLVPIVTEIAAERRMYLPLAAFAVLFVVGGYLLVAKWSRRSESDPKSVAPQRRPITVTMVAVMLLTLAYGVASARHLPTYRDAALLWADVLRHQPNNSLAHLNLGQVLSNDNQWDEATEHLKVAAELRPNDPTAHNGLGRALTNTGHLPEAIKACQRALQLNPEYPLALNNLGFALNQSGRHSDAIPFLEHALKLLPDLPDAHNNLGVALGSTGNTAQAVVHFRRAVQLDKDYPEPRKNLAFGLAQMGNLPLAIEQYKEAIRLKPDYWSAYFGLAQTLATANQPHEAIAVAEQGIRGARAAGQHADADSIEAWLRSFLNGAGGRESPFVSPPQPLNR